MDTYIVRYELDPETSWWTATVPGEPGVVSQGKTLAEAHCRVRNAISLMKGTTDPIALVGETDWSNRTDLPEEALELVKKEGDLRVQLLEVQEELERHTFDAVKLLILEEGFSFRVVGRMLGITHQRVEQILREIRTVQTESG